MAYHSPQLLNLQLAGLSPDRKLLAPNTLVRDLFSRCKTTAANGTTAMNGLNCVLDVIAKSGYGNGQTSLISPFYRGDSPALISRDLTIADIRSSLKNGWPVILEVSWFEFSPITNTWTRHGGHFVSAYGYDYNRAWGDDQIQLKIVNPLTDYGTSRKDALYNTVIIGRVAPQAGISYPAHRPFIVSGSGFGGFKDRAFVGELLTIAPQ